jgi:uncharacterized protein Usg
MRKGGLVNEARILHRLSNHPNVIQFFRWVNHVCPAYYQLSKVTLHKVTRASNGGLLYVLLMQMDI